MSKKAAKTPAKRKPKDVTQYDLRKIRADIATLQHAVDELEIAVYAPSPAAKLGNQIA